VAEGRLVVLGVTQEQHPDRCRLFAQWQRFDWPILWDPINLLESSAVPVVVAIDEHGIVRRTRPRPETFEEEFVSRVFPDDAPAVAATQARPPDLDELRQQAARQDSGGAWREFGDALVLWSQPRRLDEAVEAYSRARQLQPLDGRAAFRLGVALRMRHESPDSRPADFQHAVAAWDRALTLDPNQYIWRRRIQQYGPRLAKPYAFYDWVEQARRDIAVRGEQPVTLAVDPYGAEIAQPSRSFAPGGDDARSPDPDHKIVRDHEPLIDIEAAVVPARITAGSAARVHLTFRPRAEKQAHWNNEAEPLRFWLDLPDGWQASQRLLTSEQGDLPTSSETRRLDVEVQTPVSAGGSAELHGYALFHVCEGVNGVCQFLRQDVTLRVEIIGESAD